MTNVMTRLLLWATVAVGLVPPLSAAESVWLDQLPCEYWTPPLAGTTSLLVELSQAAGTGSIVNSVR